MKIKDLNLIEDRISKLFIGYALPGVIASLAMCLYGIVDGIILGRFIGANSLAAVNMASPIFNIISCMAILIAVGGNTLVAISLGEKDSKKANNYFNNAFFSLLTMAIVIFIIAVFFSSTLAKMLGVNEVLFSLVVTYIRTFGLFVIPIVLNIFLGISLQSIGKPQLYMAGNLLSVILNIILDLVFICTFNMGIFGAALASGISATVVFVVFFSKFINKSAILKVGKFKTDFKSITSMTYNGSSEAITQFSSGFSVLVFNYILIKKFGEVGVSAFAVVQYISLFINAVIMGMSRGMGAIVSVNFGAKQYRRIKELISLSIKIVTVIGMVCTAILLIFKLPLILLFIKNNVEVVETSQEIITFYSYNFIFIGANVIINSFYTAINNPKTSALLAVLRYALLIVNFFALPLSIGDIGLWLSFVLSEILCLIISYMCLKRTMYNMKA